MTMGGPAGLSEGGAEGGTDRLNNVWESRLKWTTTTAMVVVEERLVRLTFNREDGEARRRTLLMVGMDGLICGKSEMVGSVCDFPLSDAGRGGQSKLRRRDDRSVTS
jgi:hypothetical protein